MEFQRPPDATFPGAGEVQVIVLALVLAFLILAILRTLKRRRTAVVMGMQSCRWKRDRKAAKREGFVAWRCKTCRIEAFTFDGKPPKECKRDLRATSL